MTPLFVRVVNKSKEFILLYLYYLYCFLRPAPGTVRVSFNGRGDTLEKRASNRHVILVGFLI